MPRGISQSAMSLYRKCPYAYKIRYIDGKKPIFYAPEILDIGRYVHDAIDRYYVNHFLMEGTAKDILEKSYSHLREIWDITLPPEDLKKAYTCLQNHALWEAKNIESGIETKPLSELKINGEGFFGIIDYVDTIQKKVIDWKTGRKPYLSYEYRMQAYVYKTLYQSQFEENLKHFSFFFLFPGEWRTVSFDTEKQIQIGNDVEKLKNDILDSIQNEEFAKQPRTEKGCKYCEYKLYCKIIGGEENTEQEGEEGVRGFEEREDFEA